MSLRADIFLIIYLEVFPLTYEKRKDVSVMSIFLSKSKYCSAVQCPKMLWMSKNMPDEFDSSAMNEAVLETGNEVGDLAMGLFGEYTEVPYGDLSEMLRRTQELINAGTEIITEASFSYNGLFCSVDILKNLGNRQVEFCEVKSSTSVHDIYLDDVAYQRYVLTMLGYEVLHVSVVHINSEYVRRGDLDVRSLFTIEDVSDIAAGKHEEVRLRISAMEQYMQQTEEPRDDIGGQCFSPYPCGYFSHCTRQLPKPNIFDVSGVRTSKKIDCYKKGLISYSDLNACGSFSASQRMQIEYELFDSPPHIDAQAIRKFLKCLSYPLYFLDFESYQPAIPLYENTRPFEQIVFQYSLHYIEHEGGELKHREFLAYPGEDPRRSLAEALCEDIPIDVCTTAYNMGFEKGRIRGLAELYPDLAEHLMNIHDNIQDLMVPFQKKYYYAKAMQGSYSIKYVLPALFPDDPELDYHNLTGVHNGGEASAAFKAMAKMSPEKLEDYRAYLLRYCGLDTFAMVKLWERLKEI